MMSIAYSLIHKRLLINKFINKQFIDVDLIDNDKNCIDIRF